MVSPTDFWRGRRVFLTGHTGFKGSWLALWLHRLGAQVHGYSLPAPTTPNLFTVTAVADTLASDSRGDIRDGAALAEAMAAARPEIVFHLAAQALVRHSYQQPAETYSTNVMGTVHLLEAVRAVSGVRAVVNVTTDKCYENREWVWGYRENEAMGGHDPYSSSKGCAELVTAAYRNSFLAGQNIALASARAGNVIGGGDWAEDRLVPDMVRALSEGQAVRIRNPHAIRPWQHVLEPLSGYLRLAEHLAREDGASFASGWNFGPRSEDARPVDHLARTICRLWGDDARWELDGSDHPHEAHYLKLDCAQAHHRLHWHPRLNLDTCLTWTIDWYRAYYAGRQDMRRLCEEQIDLYQAAPGQHD